MILTSASPENNLHFYGGEKRALSVVGEHPRQVSKFPSDLFHIPTIRQQAEKQGIETRFLLTIRDPRSVITSVHANSEGKYKIGWDYALGTNKNGLSGSKTEGLLEYIQELKKYSKLPGVKYEDLLIYPDIVQEFIKSEIDIKFKSDFETFHTRDIPKGLHYQMNGVRPIDKTRIDGWKDHPERIKQQFNQCPALFDALIEFGYEKDREWIKNL